MTDTQSKLDETVDPRCPDAERMGKHECQNRFQCWEPCGELGKNPDHARCAPAQPIAATAAMADEPQRKLPNFKSLGEVVAHVIDTGEAVALTAEEGEQVMAALRKSLPQTSAADEPVAWVHEEDPARTISARQKERAIRDGGASASSVAPYSVATYTRPQPAPVAQVPKGWRELIAAGEFHKSRSKLIGWTFTPKDGGSFWGKTPNAALLAALASVEKSAMLTAAPSPETVK